MVSNIINEIKIVWLPKIVFDIAVKIGGKETRCTIVINYVFKTGFVFYLLPNCFVFIYMVFGTYL
jgi:hypothetical protein